jgi:drug/metabolite transporter (DMT)-like permease
LADTIGSIGFGLASAGGFGAGDFLGGIASKKSAVYTVIVSSQIVGTLVLLVAAMLLNQPIPPLEHFVIGAIAGAVGSFGLFCLYYSLARGKMSVAAPVSAVVNALLPVTFSIFTSGLPGTTKLIGFGLALVGVWFVSRTEEGTIRPRELAIPALAGVGFGLFFVIISRVTSVSPLWPLLGSRAASLTLFIVAARLNKQPLIVPRDQLGVTSVGGTLDMLGNVFFVISAQIGELATASVLSALYPSVTILLAWLVLKERIIRLQWVGIVLAVAAILLISMQ